MSVEVQAGTHLYAIPHLPDPLPSVEEDENFFVYRFLHDLESLWWNLASEGDKFSW